MPTITKTAAEQERQRTFELVRHFLSSKHQCPEYLTQASLLAVLSTLLGEKA